MSRCPALAAVALALVVPAGCTGRTANGPARIVAPCSWSLFGEARSVAHRGHLFTGCIGIDGTTLVEDLELETGRRRLDAVFQPLEVDDHNNPGLAIFAGDLYAFSAPHSGYAFPRDRRSRMRYRILRGGRWGAIRTVPLGHRCGLGYIYPNPVVAGQRLYLFMRGPCWTPYFTSTVDGRHWTRPRSLVRSPSPSRQDGGGTRRVRPYAKYAGTSDGSILIALSDGHPASFRSSLYFVRLEGGRFRAADGRVVGTLADLPLRFSRLDRVAPYSAAVGRAWPMDIAEDRSGMPVVVYSSLVGTSDTFFYGHWDGRHWRTRPIASAGRSLFTYHNSGITLDHADPSWVVLSRTIEGQNEIEARHTPDHGSSWCGVALTHRSSTFNIRPVIPRGLSDPRRLVVLYVSGSARSFREFDTDVVMASAERAIPPRRTGESAIQPIWRCWSPGRSSRVAGSRRRLAAAGWVSSTGHVRSISTATSPSRSSRPSASRTSGRAGAS